MNKLFIFFKFYKYIKLKYLNKKIFKNKHL